MQKPRIKKIDPDEYNGFPWECCLYELRLYGFGYTAKDAYDDYLRKVRYEEWRKRRGNQTKAG